MRGQVDPQGGLFSYFSVEERIPADHPLRRVKSQADAVLGSMSAEFDAMYASVGRPSIAPERLLKATLLIALYFGAFGSAVLRDARLQHAVPVVSGHGAGGAFV